VFNSSFLVNSLTFNDTLDIDVGGSSELNVRDIPTRTAIVTQEYQRLSNHNLCISNQTLQHNISVQIGSSPAQEVIAIENCEFGCDLDNNRCNSSPLDTLLIYGVGIAVALTVVIIIVRKVMR